MKLVWPAGGPAPGVGAPEAFVLFQTHGGRELALASNLAYEVWLDGRFAGDGAHRCAPGEAALETWDARAAREVLVRAHWIDPERTVVYLRRAFPDPFLGVESPEAWTCALDASTRASGAKAASQLPRQNLVTGPPRMGEPWPLAPAALSREWRPVDPGIRRSRVVPVPLRPIATREGTTGGEFDPCADEDLSTAPSAWAEHGLPRGAACASFDLGAIALHRVEVGPTDGPVALCWGEVPRFEETWATSNRGDVGLVDAVAAGPGGAPFGWRGGRYLHVLHLAGAPPPLSAWRREYPLDWKELPPPEDPRDAAILAACRANLVACTDGGLVDTCWRERAQWTGDLRASAVALRALAVNDEPVGLALRQIATSYDESAAMVQAVWPATLPFDRPLFIPGYHLAFCLTALEHGLARLPAEVAGLVPRSLAAWRERYLSPDGLLGLEGFPWGCWWFVDWDPERRPPEKMVGADAVTHAWFHQACQALGLPSFEPDAFEAAYWTGRAFALDRGGGESPQATAAALLAFPGSPRREAALDWLLAQEAAGGLARRVTPYFGWFVAAALGLRSREAMLGFVRGFYGPRAVRWGTIPEKTHDDASLAHGWSVAVASLLVGS